MDVSKDQLWKDNYKIGNSLIDSQHYQLFQNVERLLYITKNEGAIGKRQECESIINFLVAYTTQHFADEEKLQDQIGYVSADLHKRIHASFTRTVLLYKERLEKSFSDEYLSDFLGTLLSWLVFHVLACDSKILKNEPIGSSLTFGNAEKSIRSVVTSILTGLYGVKITDMQPCVYKGFIEGDCFVRTVVHGNKDFLIIYGISKSLAVDVFKRMSGIDIGYMDRPDSLATSAFLELGNIFSSYIAGAVSSDASAEISTTQELFIGEYTDKTYKMGNNILLDIATESGNMEIMLSYL